jgi:hypothetical protein
VGNRDWRACAIEQRESQSSCTLGDWAMKGDCARPSPDVSAWLPACDQFPLSPQTRVFFLKSLASRDHIRVGKSGRNLSRSSAATPSIGRQKRMRNTVIRHHHRSKYASLHPRIAGLRKAAGMVTLARSSQNLYPFGRATGGPLIAKLLGLDKYRPQSIIAVAHHRVP